MIELPPSVAGRDQVRRIWSLPRTPLGFAMRPVGASGVVTSVVAWATLDQGLLPARVIAATR